MSEIPNPFESARRVSGISVMLRPENITDVWSSVSNDDIERLFSIHGAVIASSMLAAGVDAAVAIIRSEGEQS